MTIFLYFLQGGGTETEEGGGDEGKTAKKEELVKKSQNSWLQSYLNTFMFHRNNRLLVNVESFYIHKWRTPHLC